MRKLCSTPKTDAPAQRISGMFLCIFLRLQRELHGQVLQAVIAAALGHLKDFRSSLVADFDGK
jgi:hypothetical protein